MAKKKSIKGWVEHTSKKKSQSSKKASTENIFGLPLRTWIENARLVSGRELRGRRTGVIVYFGGDQKAAKEFAKATKAHLLPWQIDSMQKSKVDTIYFSGKTGPVWIFRPPSVTNSSGEHYGLIERSEHARARDSFGSIVNQLSPLNLERLAIEFYGTSLEEENAALLGLELASYYFAENRANPKRPRRSLPKLNLASERTQLTRKEIQKTAALGLAMNIARHLTNLPGGTLNPKTYAEAVDGLMRGMPGVACEIWEGEKLVKERMGLLLAVGEAAEHGPRLVNIRYRPAGEPASLHSSRKPVAFVGKGITFDTGGLDLKPSSAMRLMKKDMGGSAAVVGLAYWTAQTGATQPCDFYLSLAENAVGERSFRPGDILTARNGLTIEIHNTDAEGRLVLADALDVAATNPEVPSAIIDFATLTGAIKVGLGAEIAGLFCSSDQLADELLDAARAKGDFGWRMPLFQSYKSMLRSPFADMANASDGFAGAITAALFLQQFVGIIPWAHWDIYAWKDGAGGAWSEPGGSGQPVQAIAEFLTRLDSEKSRQLK